MDHKWIIIGMMCVTMLPRITPFYLFKAEDLPPVIQSFLGNVPYTVLGALILPGGLDGLVGQPVLSALCLLVAALISWFKEGIIFPMLGAVITALVIL